MTLYLYISNADLFLYQMGRVLKIEEPHCGYWFPTTYVYHTTPQTMWQKLKSRAYCANILPLFGTQSIDEMKKMIDAVDFDARMSYRHSFESAIVIKNSVNVSEIASLN